MLSKLMNDWGESEKKQSILIDVELKEYFKYIKNEFISYKDVTLFIISSIAPCKD